MGRVTIGKNGVTVEQPAIGDAVVASPVVNKQNVGAGGHADDLLAELSDAEGEIFHEIVTFSGGKERVFHVKELSIFEMIDVETQRLYVKNGVIRREPTFEAKMGLALELFSTVYKKVGEGENATYERYFTMQSAQALLRLPAGRDLVNELFESVYTYNPELSPLVKKSRAEAMAS